MRLTLLVALIAACCTLEAAADRPPNIVLILADDLGYGDLSCHGAPDIATPNIDSLAEQGLRFTQFYASAPECSPTRAALLTGRYPQRVGGLECAIGVGNVGRYDDAIRLRGSDDLGLPIDQSMLPRLVKQAGYATALIGKWHLGYEPKFLPRRHGFDEFFGPLGGSVDYFRHTEPDGAPMLYRNEERVDLPGYLTDLIAAEASAFIERKEDQPFFLYAAFTAPHDPFQGPEDQQPTPSRQTYARMVQRLDRGVGQILQALDRAGVTANTLVIFTSDNGGAAHSNNAPFSRGKGTTFEGGIRAPCLVRWPDVFAPGTQSSIPGLTMDLTASLVRIAGAQAPADHPFDGIDLLKLAQEEADAPDRALYWRWRRGERTRCAVRRGNLKYIVEREPGRTQEFLFDLEKDIAERDNLLSRRLEDSERLRRLLLNWEVRVKPTR